MRKIGNEQLEELRQLFWEQQLAVEKALKKIEQLEGVVEQREVEQREDENRKKKRQKLLIGVLMLVSALSVGFSTNLITTSISLPSILLLVFGITVALVALLFQYCI